MKRGERVILSLLALAVVVGACWLHWRRGVAYTREELLSLARREEGLAPTRTLTVLGDYESGEERLLCLAATEEGYAPQYRAVSFHARGKAWGEPHSHLLMERGMDLYTLSWGGSYLFISGNPVLKTIRLQLPGREEAQVPVTGTPFCYRLELGDWDSFQYEFLDGEGNLISRGGLSPDGL